MIIAISTENDEPRKDHRSKEVAEHSGSDENEHSREEMKKLIEEKVIWKRLEEMNKSIEEKVIWKRLEEMNKSTEEKVIRKALQESFLKNSQPDLRSNGEQTYLFIQPFSKFTVSGVQGDADGREAHHL